MEVKTQSLRIHIDGKLRESPDPTTGAALYLLGEVKADYDLYKEVRGKGDDLLVPNADATIDLKNGDHFYSAKRTLNPGFWSVQ